MKKILVLLALPLLFAGCLSNAGADLDASSSSHGSRAKQDADEKDTGKRQVCEHTEIGGEPKSFCY